MPASLTLTTTLEPRGPACAVVLSDEHVSALGAGRRPAVRVTIGERSARLRLGVMGGENLIGLSKAARAELDVEIGDVVTVTIEVDDVPREVTPPPALAAALAAHPDAAAAFERLSYTHRREYAEWVAGAKRDDTRERRVDQAVPRILDGLPKP